MEKIMSRRNGLAVHMKKLGASRSYRTMSGEYLCDGARLLEEAINSDVVIKAVLTASGLPFPIPPETRLFYAARDLIDSLSPLKNAQDTIFICKMPSKCLFTDVDGVHILLDGVQDPGNVGSIIRTADAFDISGIIMTGGCADPYNPKTLRASMGAIFRQKIFDMSYSELVWLRESGHRFVGAALSEDCRDISDVKIKGSIIAIGSEGRGLSSEVLELCSDKITIPMRSECQSLNAAAAAAIIIWESTRGREECP